MVILEILHNWVVYPLIVYFALSYAKESATKELNKLDQFVYFASIISLLMGGTM